MSHTYDVGRLLDRLPREIVSDIIEPMAYGRLHRDLMRDVLQQVPLFPFARQHRGLLLAGDREVQRYNLGATVPDIFIHEWLTQEQANTMLAVAAREREGRTPPAPCLLLCTEAGRLQMSMREDLAAHGFIVAVVPAALIQAFRFPLFRYALWRYNAKYCRRPAGV